MNSNTTWFQSILDFFKGTAASPYFLWGVAIGSALLAFCFWSMIRESDTDKNPPPTPSKGGH